MPEYPSLDRKEQQPSSSPLGRSATSGLTETITQHYSVSALGMQVLRALEKAGKDSNRLTVEDLAPIDEFPFAVGRRRLTSLERRGLSRTTGCWMWAAVLAGRRVASRASSDAE